MRLNAADEPCSLDMRLPEMTFNHARDPLTSMVRELIEEEVNEISLAPAITRESSFIEIGFV